MANKAMSKTQIIAHLAESAQIQKKTAVQLVEELASLAIKETKRVGQFVIPGLGKLRKVQRKARKGRNPQTQEIINIPAKTVVRFRVAKACRDAVVGAKK
jgi:DNA-binding protein HU-beta